MVKRIFSLMVVMFVSAAVFAAPYNGGVFKVRQPDGSVVKVRGYGDEFYGRFESLDGYTLTNDEDGMLVYADISQDGTELKPLDVRYNPNEPTDTSLTEFRNSTAAANNNGVFPESLDIKSDVIRKIRLNQIDKYEADQYMIPAEQGLQKESVQQLPYDPETFEPKYYRPVTGEIEGLTIVVEFSDITGDIPVSAEELGEGEQRCVENFCNMVGYGADGNNGSVRDYYYGVSNGKLTYTNQVVGYYTAENDFSYYNNGPGSARGLIREALNGLSDQIDVSTLTIDPTTEEVQALNIMYAGNRPNEWGAGLWPHKWNLSAGGGETVTIDGATFDVYEITDMGTTEDPAMEIGTFCHENGHMLCGYPDLYDYGYESSGIGSYGLMAGGSYGGNGANPMAINGYFRWLSGWEIPQYLTNKSEGHLHTALGSEMQATEAPEEDWETFEDYQGNIFVFMNEENLEEFFVIENIINSGRKGSAADSGLAVWHVDEGKGGYGANDQEHMTPDKHYHVSLEQADGRFDLEKGIGQGDGTDLFGAPQFPKFFAEQNVQPNSVWWNGEPSGLSLYEISEPDGEVTFYAEISPKYARIVRPSGADPTDMANEVERFKTIQEAFEAAQSGDDIYVADGFEYYEFLDTVGKSLSVYAEAADPNDPNDDDWQDYMDDYESVPVEPTSVAFNIDYMDYDPDMVDDPNEIPSLTVSQGEQVRFEDFGFKGHPYSAIEVSGNSLVSFENCSFDNHGTGAPKEVLDDTGQFTLDPETGDPLLAPSIEYNDFSDNSNAIVLRDGNVELSDCQFSGNIGRGEGGSCIYGEGQSSVIAENTEFTGNTSKTDAGAVFLKDGYVELSACMFEENEARFNGGSICLESVDDNSIIRDSEFASNSVNIYGGALYSSDCSIEFINNLLYDCTSNWYGGAVYFDSPHAQNSVINCTFDNNDGLVAGGAIYLTGAAEESLFYNNIFSNTPGYAVYEAAAGIDVKLRNNLFFKNGADYWDENVVGYIGASQLNSPAMRDSKGNMDDDPMYVEGYLGEHYLSNEGAGQILDQYNRLAADWGSSATSPCVDAGYGEPSDYDIGSLSTRTDNAADGNKMVDIGYHYTDPNQVYDGAFRVSINVSPEEGGEAAGNFIQSDNPSGQEYVYDFDPADPNNFNVKPFQQVVLEVTADSAYMFEKWLDEDGEQMTEILGDGDPNSDFYAFYDENGQPMYVDNEVGGEPYKIVMTIDQHRDFFAELVKQRVELTVYVKSGNGTVYQDGELKPVKEYAKGEVVDLRAEPAESEHKVQWTGTDNDASLSLTNQVTVREQQQVVEVEFYQPNVWTVGMQADSSFSDSLRNIITNPSFEDGDVVQVMPGEYAWDDNTYPDTGWNINIDRPVVIEGATGNPDDVSIRDGRWVFWDVGRNTIIRNMTFDHTGQTYSTVTNYNGKTPENPFFNGDNGTPGGGSIMRFCSLFIPDYEWQSYGNSYYPVLTQGPEEGKWITASPTIENCNFINATFDVANGSNGASDDSNFGEGGWPGYTLGGALTISDFCEPRFVNCTFEGCEIQGGHGGNGSGIAGYGGMWDSPENPAFGYDDDDIYGAGNVGFPRFVLPFHKRGVFYETYQIAGDDGIEEIDVLGGEDYPAPVDEQFLTYSYYNSYGHAIYGNFSSIEPKASYGGRGGAAYIGIGARPEFISCEFIENNSQSGSSGIRGGTAASPEHHWRVPSFGGAVFCDARSEPLFENCLFRDNIANYEIPTTHPDGGEIEDDNSYMSYGGAVYANRNSLPVFRNCRFEGNEAVVGGAICVDNIGVINNETDQIENLIVEDCIFTGNISSVGGAVTSTGGSQSRYEFLSEDPLFPGIGPLVYTDDQGNQYEVYRWNFAVDQNEDPITGDPWGPKLNETVSHSAGFSAFIRNNFTENTANLFITDIRTTYTDDEGNVLDPVDIGEYSRAGLGGALALFTSKNQIVDCQLSENVSGGFGGGMYISGKTLTDVLETTEYRSTYLRNVLMNNNYSAFGGGGLCSSKYSDPQLINCTLADNVVTSSTGKGGGILATNDSYVSAINSIFHGNLSSNGAQIAVNEVNEGEPSTADIRYSLIEEGNVEQAPIDMGIEAVRPVRNPAESSYSISDQEILLESETDLYDFDPEEYGNDFSSSLIEMGFTVNFYEQTTNSVFVNENGCLSFWQALSEIQNYLLSSDLGTPVIAPFHADVDTSRGNTAKAARGTARVITEDGSYIDTKVFAVTWNEVGYYESHLDKVNKFQVVLIDRSDRGENDFDIEFNYDQIEWETGDDQNGTDGLGGNSAVVGFSDGTGTPGNFYELSGSGQPSSFLDNSTTALIARSRNSNAMGRLVFRVEDGQPHIKYGSPVYTNGSSKINYNADFDRWDPAANNIVGDPVWAQEGVYYLNKKSIAIDPNKPESPCFDKGAGNARDYDIYRHTTTTDNELDTDRVDIGYHYVLPTTEGLEGDFNFDGVISQFEAVESMAEYWLDDCYAPYWCHGRDLNEDGIVNTLDRTAMANLSEVDSVAPQPLYGENGDLVEQDFTEDQPRRMTWETKPISNGSGVGEIRMVASLTTDNCIGSVEYQFQMTYPETKIARDWDTSREFLDTGLNVGDEYSYRCRARDAQGNETKWSLAGRTVAGDDSTPPITDLNAENIYKSKWALSETGMLLSPHVVNVAGGMADIKMVAVEATDENGVEYYFECTSGNGHDSGWIEEPEYIDTDLPVGELYTYRVRTRDLSRNFNLGEWSDEASAFASIENIIDTEPPAPLSYIIGADIVEGEYLIWDDYVYHTITALTDSIDISQPVWYQFICLTNSSLSSPKLIPGGIIMFDSSGERLDPQENADLIAEEIENMKGEAAFADEGDQGGTVTWTVPIGPTGTTSRWKVICGDAEGNTYTLDEQEQIVIIRSFGIELNLDDVERDQLVINPDDQEDDNADDTDNTDNTDNTDDTTGGTDEGGTGL
ncbi:M6 family metalloprotease domain-containing protein [Sedimentisphaera salicampi]|uniref:M6 family metalloprotease domain protein n=1 Tax=Sedimentisphaera salicampi TaxID=1941349 RepID=A0A1W6LKY1_9BACT|nr:M6 family metalloprotease domain-containing protein [Sedimentisphaera salicampi]ARN56403.1 M6 family metalloprotease domain protein [Sedimentisphaera salicampi]